MAGAWLGACSELCLDALAELFNCGLLDLRYSRDPHAHFVCDVGKADFFDVLAGDDVTLLVRQQFDAGDEEPAKLFKFGFIRW